MIYTINTLFEVSIRIVVEFCLPISEAAWMLVLFIATWVYFPAKPPTPPSASAETKREVVLSGARILFT